MSKQQQNKNSKVLKQITARQQPSSTARYDSSNLSGQTGATVEKIHGYAVIEPAVVYTHVIKLTPVGAFFFGNESVNATDNSMFYFQKSRDYPQQTSLLGMLRYQVLVQNGQLEFIGQHEKLINTKEAEGLIGSGSFDESADQSFGAIEALSPVCLIKDKEWLFPFPMVGREKITSIIPSLVDNAGEISWSDEDSDSLTTLADYREKTGLDIQYAGGSSTSIEHTDLYDHRETARIGINKPRRETNMVTDSEGFFKLHARRLKEKVAFGCCIRLKESVKLTDGWVVLGKERSVFKMKVTTLKKEVPFQVPNLMPGSGAIWLLSDACVDADIYNYCQFAITQSIGFRNIRTSLNQTNHFARPARRPHRRELLQRGSILFPKPGQAEKLKAALNDPAFTKIGYNFYAILT